MCNKLTLKQIREDVHLFNRAVANFLKGNLPGRDSDTNYEEDFIDIFMEEFYYAANGEYPPDYLEGYCVTIGEFFFDWHIRSRIFEPHDLWHEKVYNKMSTNRDPGTPPDPQYQEPFLMDVQVCAKYYKDFAYTEYDEPLSDAYIMSLQELIYEYFNPEGVRVLHKIMFRLV